MSDNAFELDENMDGCPGHKFTDGGDIQANPWCEHCGESEWAVDIYIRDKLIDKQAKQLTALRETAWAVVEAENKGYRTNPERLHAVEQAIWKLHPLLQEQVE